MLAGGFLMTFAAGMSSNPSESDRVGRKGCWTMVVALVVLIAAATAIWS